ncbi:MAG: hypothetical protein M3Z46_08905 [Actinomycetota bacterium]|nr:hypothetical protein [Actinomycetota bacterium]
MTAQATARAATGATSRSTVPAQAPVPRRTPRRLESSAAASRVAIVALAACAARLRWDRFGASGLYLDDAWVAISTRVNGLNDLLRIGSSSPGFVLFLARPWTFLFGSSTTSLQLLPFVLGVIAPPLCFVVARAWKIRFGPAVLAGALLAVSPIHRMYSANFKQYTAEAIASLLLLWGGSFVVAEPGDRRRWIWLVVGCIAATVFSMSETIVALGVLSGAALATAQRDQAKIPRVAVVAIESYLLVAVAWYAVALRPHLNSALYTFWHAKFIHLGNGFATVPRQVFARLQSLLAGFSGLDPRLMMVMIAAAAVALLLGRPALGIAVIVPTGLALVLALGEVAPIGTGRTDIYLYPTFALLLSAGIDQIVRALPRRTAGPTGLATAAIAGLILARTQPGLTPYVSENMRPLVQRLEREKRSGDTTIIYPLASFSYGLYTRSAVHIRADEAFPMSFFVQPDDPRSFVLPMDRTHPSRYAHSIDIMTRGQHRVWLIGTHFWSDWSVIRSLMTQRGFRVALDQAATGSLLILYTRP